jgi:hypothetical protein
MDATFPEPNRMMAGTRFTEVCMTTLISIGGERVFGALGEHVRPLIRAVNGAVSGPLGQLADTFAGESLGKLAQGTIDRQVWALAGMATRTPSSLEGNRYFRPTGVNPLERGEAYEYLGPSGPRSYIVVQERYSDGNVFSKWLYSKSEGDSKPALVCTQFDGGSPGSGIAI